MGKRRDARRGRSRLKLVLASLLVVGAVASVTARSVYGLLSGQVGNQGTSISSGTFTLNDTNAGDSASTTLADKLGTNHLTKAVGVAELTGNVGVTTLTGAIAQTTLGAAVVQTTVAGDGTLGTNLTTTDTTMQVLADTGFPATGNYVVQVGAEQMLVTAGQGTTTWTVTRHYNGTTAATHAVGVNVNPGSITVTSTTGFPATPFAIQVDSEPMTVTAESGVGNTTWAVTRPSGATAVTHSSGTAVNQATITVSSAASFPSRGTYTIQVDSEQMTVTAGQGTTTWTVTRAANSTTAATHASAAEVDQASFPIASLTSFSSGTGFTIQIDSEQMTVTKRSGSTPGTLTVTRAANGTTAAAHVPGVDVYQTTVNVASASSFPSSGNYAIEVDNEQMAVTAGQGTTTWTVARGVNGTDPEAHASATTVNQASMTVASASGFPASSEFAVQVGSEEVQVVAGMGTTSWTVVRGANGTSVAAHASGAAVATSPCSSVDGTDNVISSCDSVVTYSPNEEAYPGDSVVSRVAITDSGSIGASDLQLWMPSCLRGIAPDSPLASSVPAAPTFGAASSTGGSLVELVTYYYEITAVGPSGESIAGAEASYTPPDGTTTNQITLTWAAVSGATSYNVYRSSYDTFNYTGPGSGGEQLLASGISGTSYVDDTATTPSGSPPAGVGSGDLCTTGYAQFSVEETNASGTPTYCWYPDFAAGACSFYDYVGNNGAAGSACADLFCFDLGLFSLYYDVLGNMNLGAGPTALDSRYFKVGLQVPPCSDFSTTDECDSLQGTTADFTLDWYANS